MAQSLAQIYVHIVFSTKNRQPFLKDKAFRERVHAYLKGICDNQDSPSLQIGGVEDHVHILCRLSKVEQPSLADFHWQNGYGAFSISPSHVETLKEYIKNQEEHHRARDVPGRVSATLAEVRHRV